MSVRIQPNHTTIGVPQWRHQAAHTFGGQSLPDMTGLALTADTEYDLVLPDSVWLTVMEDLQEHFARKAADEATATRSLMDVGEAIVAATRRADR